MFGALAGKCQKSETLEVCSLEVDLFGEFVCFANADLLLPGVDNLFLFRELLRFGQLS